MDIATLLENAAENFATKTLERYDAFLVANAKPLTMAERVKGVKRLSPPSFEDYLAAALASTKGTIHKCDFVARQAVSRGRTLDRLPPGMMRWPSPDGLCHEEGPTGRHNCHHPAFGRDPYMGARYGTHYSGTYSEAAVEGLHKEEVHRARTASWRDIDFS